MRQSAAAEGPHPLRLHDADGSWQLLCGGQHEEASSDGAAILCWEDALALDPSLDALASLCPLWEAERDALDAPWRIHDRMEDIVHDNVAKHGCHVMLVSDDEGPRFAYSIGLTKTYGQPERVCFGLRGTLMHWMINEVASRYASGETFENGQRVSGLLEGYDCQLRTMARARYSEFLGYARWFYDGDAFEAFQIVWPSRDGRFPWDEGFTDGDNQPSTW